MIMEKKKLIQFMEDLKDDDLVSVIFYSKHDVESHCDKNVSWDDVIEEVDSIIESVAGQVNQVLFEYLPKQ